jgi:hypothetical protein
MKDAIAILRQCDIQPTPQRIAVVEYVLKSKTHPTADEVLLRARKKCPTVSRATVYNTLNLLVEKKLLEIQTLREGAVVFDPKIERLWRDLRHPLGSIAGFGGRQAQGFRDLQFPGDPARKKEKEMTLFLTSDNTSSITRPFLISIRKERLWLKRIWRPRASAR